MSKIVIVGPSASGKTFLKSKLIKKGFKFSVSYTTRAPRKGEIHGIDYNFLTLPEFISKKNNNELLEYNEYPDGSGIFYGQGLKEFDECNLFVMETNGVASLSKEQREKCFVIFIDTDERVRVERMKERGQSIEKIYERINHDRIAFKDFFDYDIRINNANF